MAYAVHFSRQPHLAVYQLPLHWRQRPDLCRWSLLSVLQVGSGLQIFVSSSLTLILGALGFLSPAVRGAMLSTLLGMYMLMSMVAGFSAVYLHGLITRSHWAWRGIALRTTAAVPIVLAFVFLFLNLIIKHTGSTGAIPFGALLTFVATWLFVCFPLGYLGGFLATKTPLIEFPTRVGAVPRQASHPSTALLTLLTVRLDCGHGGGAALLGGSEGGLNPPPPLLDRSPTARSTAAS